MTSETWLEITERHVSNARTWDMSEPLNRAGLRHWLRARWWARWGKIISGLIGGAVGFGLLQIIWALT